MTQQPGADQAELLDVLATLRAHYPEWRLGQTISNVAGWADQDVWNIDDDRFLAAAKDHLRALTANHVETSTSRV